MEIRFFRGRYRALSNFYPCSLEWEGLVYPTTEHAYQASKTTEVRLRRAVRDLATPGDAKRFGGALSLRPGWDEMKLGIMLELLRRKFAQPTFRELLLGTGDAQLVEGNTHGDRFWGQVDNVGENHLGRLLMQVRNEIRNEKSKV